MPRFRRVRNGDVVTVPDVLSDRYATDPRYELVDEAAPPVEPPPPADSKPHRDAPVADWRAYAINNCGVPSHEAGAMTKPQLIKKVG